MHNIWYHFNLGYHDHRQQGGRLMHSCLIFLLLSVVFQLPLSMEGVGNPATFLLSSAFFACCIPLNTLFDTDLREGILEQFWVTEQSLIEYLIARLFLIFIFYILPLVLIVAGSAVLFGLFINQVMALTLSFLCSSTILLFWGSTIAALSFGNKNSSFLTIIMLVPLGIPSLLISQATIAAATSGFSIKSYMAIHGGLVLISAAICLALCPLALKQAIDER